MSVAIRTASQAALLETQRINTRIRSAGPATIRLKVRSDGRLNRFTKRKVTFGKAGNRRIPLLMNRLGRKRLSTCGAKTVRVVATYMWGGKRKKATSRKKLAASPEQCPPPILPPLAIDDNPLTDEDSARYVEVLSNDVDRSGTSLTVVSVDDSASTGSASVAGGRVRYDPDGGFEDLLEGQSSSDSFTYTIEDGKGQRASATVTVDIEGVDDPPLAIDDNPLTDEDSARYVEVLSNDVDRSGTSLTVVSVDDSASTGSASVAGGRVRYDPDGGFEDLLEGQSSSDSFTYTIEDGKGQRASATVTVDIEGVDDPPLAIDDNPLTDEDSARYVEVLSNDVDRSGTSLTVVSVDDSASTGSASIAGGRVRYDPDGGFEDLLEGQSSSDSFTYTIEDGKGQRASATVTVDIEGVDDPSSVKLEPALYPEFAPEISDYVTRCTGGPITVECRCRTGELDRRRRTGSDRWRLLDRCRAGRKSDVHFRSRKRERRHDAQRTLPAG